MRDCGHNQDMDPFAVEEPGIDLAAEQRTTKRKVADDSHTNVDSSEDLYFKADYISSEAQPAGVHQKRKRRSDGHSSRSSCKKRIVDYGEAVHVKFKTPRKKYVSSFSSVDYELLLAVQLEDSSLEAVQGKSAESGIVVDGVPSGTVIAAPLVEEQARASSVARANRVGVILIEDSDSDNNDNEPPQEMYQQKQVRDAELARSAVQYLAESARVGKHATKPNASNATLHATSAPLLDVLSAGAASLFEVPVVVPPVSAARVTVAPQANFVVPPGTHSTAPVAQPTRETAPPAVSSRNSSAIGRESATVSADLARSTSTSSRTSTVPALISISQPPSMTVVSGITMGVLHGQILASCVKECTNGGDADEEGFINNAANSHRDNAAAQVNEEYNGFIESLSELSRDQRVQLFLCTFDWVLQSLPQKDQYLSDLMHLERRMEHLMNSTYMLDALTKPQQQELEDVYDALDTLTNNQDAYFKRIERAGLEVLFRLRPTPSSRIKKKMVVVGSWPASILDARNKLHKRIRAFEDAYGEAVESWEYGKASSSDEAGSDYSSYHSDDEATGAGRLVQAAVPVGRVREAAKEAGTMVRKPNVQRDNAAPQRTNSGSSQSKTGRHGGNSVGQSLSAGSVHTFARAGSHRLHQSGESTAAGLRDSVTRPISGGHSGNKTARISETVPQHKKTRRDGAQFHYGGGFDDDFGVYGGGDDRYDEVPSAVPTSINTREEVGYYAFASDGSLSASSDGDDDSLVTGRGVRGRSDVAGASRRGPHRYKHFVPTSGSRSTASFASVDAARRCAGASDSGGRSLSKVQRDMEQVFGRRRSITGGSKKSASGTRSAPAETGRDKGGRSVRVQRNGNDSFYTRRRPTVADLPAHVRYHGRVVVLESLLNNPASGPVGAGFTRSNFAGSVTSHLAAPRPVPANVAPAVIHSSTLPAGVNLCMSESSVVRTLAVGSSLPPASTLFQHAPAVPNDRNGVGSHRSVAEPSRTTQQADVRGEGDSAEDTDEDMVDLVLSGMANPYMTEPSLHLQQPFYQVGHGAWDTRLHVDPVNDAKQVAMKAWAVGFCSRLSANATSGSDGGSSTAMNQLAAATLASVSEVLNRLTSYQALESRCSALQSSQQSDRDHTDLEQRRKTALLNARFQRKETWTALVSFGCEKLSRIGCLLYEVLDQCCDNDGANRLSRLTHLMQQGYGALQRKFCAHLTVRLSMPEQTANSQWKFSRALPKPGELLSPSDLAGSLMNSLAELHPHKCDEFAIYLQLCLLRHKVSALVHVALRTMDVAKCRPVVDSTDKVATAVRLTQERADWDVMNCCFSEVLAVQDSVIAALLWNKRLLLGILYHMSANSAHTGVPSAEGEMLGVEFKRGVSCTIRTLAALLFEVLRGLRRMHSTINAARICANGSASNGRIWACYDASREQVNGKIATYHKNVWTEIVTAVLANVARAKANLFGCDSTINTSDAVKGAVGTVNPSTWSQARTSEPVETAGLDGDTLWGVLTVVSHFLRTVNIAVSSTGSQASATPVAPRVDGCWNLLRALTEASSHSICQQCPSAAAPSEASANRPELTAQLLRTLRRVSLFGAVWTDALTEAPALYLNVLSQSSAAFTTLLPVVVPSTGPRSKSGAESTVATKKAMLDDRVDALDCKSVLLLCFHAYFSCAKQTIDGDGAESRSSMHQQLLYTVSMLFKACGVPNPYDLASSTATQSLNAVLSNDATAEHQAAACQESMRVINDIRRTFKALLYNATTEPYNGRDVVGVSANLAAIKSTAAKVPKMYAKSALLTLLTKNSAASFQCGMLVCLLVKELTAVYGQNVVRNKLKLAPHAPVGVGTGASKESAISLQEQLMRLVRSTVVTEISGGTGGAPTSGASDGRVDSASLSAQVEQLLQRLPLHQQRNLEGGAVGAGSAVVDPSLSSTLCLYIFTGLLTFVPFPAAENGVAARVSTNGSASVTEADIKRILDAHRTSDLHMEPTLQVLRFIAKLHAERTLVQSPELMKALLGTALSASASILRYMQSDTSEDCLIPLRCGMTEHTRVLRCLHAPLLKETIDVVHFCLSQATGVKSRDGLHVSAVFVVGLLVKCLSKWYRQHAELSAALATASNAEPAALTLLNRTLLADGCSFQEVLAAFLHMQLVPTSFGRVAAPAAASATNKPTGSELVVSLKALLVQLAGTLKSQDVVALDFSSACKSSDGGFGTAQMRKLKTRKLNTSAGACFAICKSLGDLVAIFLNVAVDTPNSSADRQTQLPGSASSTSAMCSAAFVQSLIVEVLECLEKISVAAAGGNNILLGHWLRITFWVPVLQCISALCCRSCSIDVSSLLQAHIPALISDWCSCAVVREGTATSRVIAEHISLSEYCEHLTALSNVMVMSVNFKYASLGASKLSSSELQSWRLCELYLQVFETNPADSMNARNKVVQFLRLLASGGTSAVLGEVLLVNNATVINRAAPNSTRALLFPAAQRVAFERTNAVLVKDLCRSLQCLAIAAFKTSDSKELTRLRDLVTDLKALVAEASYLTRSLQLSPTMLARVKVPCVGTHSGESSGGYGAVNVSYELDSVPLTAQLLREINQLPSMIPLDLVGTFITDFIMPEVITLLNSMFQYVLGEHIRSNDPSHNGASAPIPVGDLEASLLMLQELAERNLVCNLPRYILMTTCTPYSTRQIDWRKLLVPIFINSTYCTAGTAASKDSENVLLSERTMDEVPYFMLLVWALTLAMPLPERLALLVPALRRDSANLLRADFEQLFCAHLKVPVKSSTAWKLYKIFASTVTSTIGTASDITASVYSHTTENARAEALRQDPQLARFRQYLLLSAGAATTAASGVGYSALSSAANTTWLTISAQTNGLWEILHSSARTELDERIASEQGKLAVQANKFAHMSAATVMTVLPWTAVKTSLHLHLTAFDKVIEALIDRHAGATAPNAAHAGTSNVFSPPQSLLCTRSISQAPITLTSVEKEELLCFVITSAVHIVRVALTTASVHQAVTQDRLVLDSVKQRLLLLIQYCRLSAAAVVSQHQQVFPASASVSDHPALGAEAGIVRSWATLLRELRLLLSAPSIYVIEGGVVDPLAAFKEASLVMLRGLYGYAHCKKAASAQHVNATTCGSIQGFLTAVTQSYGSCTCGLCTSTSASAAVSAVVASTSSDTCVHTLEHYMKLLDACTLGTPGGASLRGSLQVAGIPVDDICNEVDSMVSSVV